VTIHIQSYGLIAAGQKLSIHVHHPHHSDVHKIINIVCVLRRHIHCVQLKSETTIQIYLNTT